MATRQVKQITLHQAGECADMTGLPLKQSSPEENGELQSERTTPCAKLKPCAEGDASLPPSQTETSPDRKGGWRHVKVSQEHMAGKS